MFSASSGNFVLLKRSSIFSSNIHTSSSLSSLSLLSNTDLVPTQFLQQVVSFLMQQIVSFFLFWYIVRLNFALHVLFCLHYCHFYYKLHILYQLHYPDVTFLPRIHLGSSKMVKISIYFLHEPRDLCQKLHLHFSTLI